MKTTFFPFAILVVFLLISCSDSKYKKYENTKWTGLYGDDWSLDLIIDKVDDNYLCGELHKPLGAITYFEGYFFGQDSISLIEKDHVYKSKHLQLHYEYIGEISVDSLVGQINFKFYADKSIYDFILVKDKSFSKRTNKQALISNIYDQRKTLQNKFKILSKERQKSEKDFSGKESSFWNDYLAVQEIIKQKTTSTNDQEIIKYFSDICYYDSLLYSLSLNLNNASNNKTVDVHLTERTNLDAKYGLSFSAVNNFICPFTITAKEKLVIPKAVTEKYYFVTLTTGIGDNLLSILVSPQTNGQLLYIDINDDENLTNDGPPKYFANSDSILTFQHNSIQDENQRCNITLGRKFSIRSIDAKRDSLLTSKLYDNSGNIDTKNFRQNPYIRNLNPNFAGKKDEFYILHIKNLAIGEQNFDGTNYKIAILDKSSSTLGVPDGLFNGKNDLLYIDLNRDGLFTDQDNVEAFNLYETVPISNKQYKINYVDSYGSYIQFIETSEKATNYYQSDYPVTTTPKPSVTSGEIDQDLWDYNLTTINGDTIRLNELKGKYVLLNFWGEWCSPCINEIPHLVDAFENNPRSRFEIVSFLKSKDLEKAQKMIKKNSMEWPQIELTKELIEWFKISGYPTNILIFPDGIRFERTNFVDDQFFTEFIE